MLFSAHQRGKKSQEKLGNLKSGGFVARERADPTKKYASREASVALGRLSRQLLSTGGGRLCQDRTPRYQKTRRVDEILVSPVDASRPFVQCIRGTHSVLPDGLAGLPVLGHRAVRRGPICQKEEARGLRVLRSHVHRRP